MTKKTILTEKSGKKRIRWTIVLTSLPVLVGAGAFAIVQPSETTAPIEQRWVTNDVEMPVVANDETLVLNKEERIQSGDSLAAVLARMGISDPAALKFLREQGSLQGLQQIRAGKVLQATTDLDGSLIKLSFTDSDGKEVRVEQKGNSFQVIRGDLTLDYNVAMTAGTITNSLFGATDAAGLPDDIATELADMFGSEINFHKGLKKGDRFKVVYETFSYQGRVVKTGKLLAAEFVNGSKTYRAVSFTAPNGRTEFYTPEGENLRKAFLQSPMEFTRVTSGFAMRLHPVLGQWKQHKGVDYGAPTGTKVKVTADGVVSFAGVKNGYGNVVEVKHFGDYSTLYAHLSGFAPGLKVGTKVQQGDLIAFVGQTGWATGPHLHYEFKVAGEAKDPLSTVVPLAMPLDPKLKPLFTKQTGELMAKFDLMEHAWGKSLD
ncbi:peptidoglycan DD-metalloendopeptidase family protein [Leeia sp. TBRC 13508]|uniref:Peptidoglycan DD-metalloendopeptidase family protein n=1 Tax=Leeia speluncae TaxID=2884804 RepID=A0ABS8D2E1_9NEIS|nr:peptidoglycan DD-metalloendopeptidase family protein [Leeia speluncae]MCB6182143.1 peptidoglycan DD-metalloendopeptidase family protein [Leeia speluncae]